MASVTLNESERWAPGLTIGAYPRSNWATWQLPPSGTAVGAATATGIVAADGTVEFTGLAEVATYFAARSTGVGGYVSFRTSRAGASSAGTNHGAWAPLTDYAQYDLVIQGGITYFANVAFTSGAVFDVANWTSLPTGTGADALATKQSVSEKAVANGYPSLDGTGKVPAGQLPVPTTIKPVYITGGVDGTLSVGQGLAGFEVIAATTITNVVARVGVSPTTEVAVDVNKNGTTIFTTQGNRPKIAAAAKSSGLVVPAITALAAGDYLTFDVDSIGTSVPSTPTFVVSEAQATIATPGSSFSVDRPALAQTGDVHVVAIRHTKGATDVVWTPPSGWTLFGPTFSAISTTVRLYHFWYIDSGAAGPFVWNVASGTNPAQISAQKYVYRGAHATTPIDSSSFLDVTVADTAMTWPSHTTVNANTMLLATMWLNSSINPGGVPSGYTSRVGWTTSASNHAADLAQAVAGSSAALSSTLSATRTAVLARIGIRSSGGGAAVPGSYLTVTVRGVET